MRIEDVLGNAILEVLEKKPSPKISHSIWLLDGTIKETTKDEYISNIDDLIEDHKEMLYFIKSLPYASDFRGEYDNYIINTDSKLSSALCEWQILKKYRKYTTTKCSTCNGTGARMVTGSGYAPCYCANGQISQEVY